MVECECGERTALSASESTCRCGVDHTALIGERSASRPLCEAASHFRSDECNEWRENQDEYLRSEKDYQLELSAIG
jgi:hypothetical protein